MRKKSPKNYYAILKIERSASAREVKQAFRKMALQYHPDRAGVEGVESFMLIKEAHDVLSDDAKRAAYDTAFFAPPEEPPKPAKHNLSFVSEFLRKRKPGPDPLRMPALKVTIERNQCVNCRGYGVVMDKYGMLRGCKYCNGDGRRRR